MDKKRITITFLIVLTNAVGATAILPMLPIYAEEQFRATPVHAMFVIAAYYAAQLVAAPWLGKLSDRFGRRSILISSQVGTVLSYLLFIFASPLGDHVGTAFGLRGERTPTRPLRGDRRCLSRAGTGTIVPCRNRDYCNSDMRVAEVRKFCKLDEAGEGLVRAATSCCA
jgi:hypothetical protein